MTRVRAAKLAVMMIVASFLVTTFLPLNTSYAAAKVTTIGIVDFQLLVSKHPDMAKAQEDMQAAVNQAKSNFETESVKMNEQEKKDYYNQLQQMLQVKQQTLTEAIQAKVMAAVKSVAEAKGLKVVVDRGAVVYSSLDITDEVLKKITTK